MPLPGPSYCDAGLRHHPSGLVPPDRKAVRLQLLGHPTTPITLPRLGMDRVHAGQQRHLVRLYCWHSVALPVRRASTATHVEHLTEHGDWPRAGVLRHKGILRLGSFTKKRMAFF
jgi:hypothetical protein